MIVLAISTALQYIAAILAFRLGRESGRMVAWLFISLAILLMSIRRTISLARLGSGDLAKFDFAAEGVALLISVLMVTGLFLISPIFKKSREADRFAKLNQQLERELEQRLRAEEALQAKARELQESNDELQHFANTVSHDLQEPLRAIDGYCNLLKLHHEEQLDEDGRKFIGRTIDSTKRMQILIQKLLQYARAGRDVKDTATAFDVTEALKQAERNLAKLIAESGAEIEASTLPEIKSDPLVVVQVFQNLIANAIKYSASETRPRILISVQEESDRWEFKVQDNGRGIEPNQIEKIFDIFYRDSDASGGSGIGLATCRKLITRVGGKIWAESTVGKGSTFTFTVAK